MIKLTNLALLLSALLSSLLITGCAPNAIDSAQELQFPSMPEELADCRVYYVTNRNYNVMTVVRCPLSATTVKTPNGRSSRTTVTIDGVEYEPTKAKKNDN